ncbi:MAG: TIM44-related membrane protein TimA [Caulobacteraceae bacterium]|nr:TIM44-related membrane protein TimA [Caulobacter sp.]RYF95627.1 MAG: TIM44-related membrane protein TimA [Caulobacteraceae bacterium]
MNQTLQLILFAILAGVVLYQLYSVLGRRVGRQPEDAQAEAIERGEARPPVADAEPIPDGVVLTGLAALRARDANFDIGHFLAGAKGAYQMVVTAFAEGDRETLKRLLSPAVYDSFEGAIAAREAEGASETVEFNTPPRADLESATMDGDIAHIVVRFLAEFRARTKNAEGEAVDDRRTAELWTFERDVTTRDPNWVLVNVDAAEA